LQHRLPPKKSRRPQYQVTYVLSEALYVARFDAFEDDGIAPFWGSHSAKVMDS
jgi:hypothetical protein